jgi:hypothetical protein
MHVRAFDRDHARVDESTSEHNLRTSPNTPPSASWWDFGSAPSCGVASRDVERSRLRWEAGPEGLEVLAFGNHEHEIGSSKTTGGLTDTRAPRSPRDA